MGLKKKGSGHIEKLSLFMFNDSILLWGSDAIGLMNDAFI
jgi:hypothetical protein